jgi:hypothetical protein
MVIQTLREFTERVAKSAKESKEAVRNYADSLVDDARSYVYDTANSTKDYTLSLYKDANAFLGSSLDSSLNTLYFYDMWAYRNKYISETSLASRINTVILLNVPFFIFAHGLRRIRNPILFTIVAGSLVLPELANPFNRE